MYSLIYGNIISCRSNQSAKGTLSIFAIGKVSGEFYCYVRGSDGLTQYALELEVNLAVHKGLRPCHPSLKKAGSSCCKAADVRIQLT